MDNFKIERFYDGELCETLTPNEKESLSTCVLIAIGEFLPPGFDYDLGAERDRIVKVFGRGIDDGIRAAELPITLPNGHEAQVRITDLS